MDLLPSEIARLVWAYLSDFDELKDVADQFLNNCPHLRELTQHLKRGGRSASRKVNEKTLQDHLNDINKPATTTIEFDEQRLICTLTHSIEGLMKKQLSQLSRKTDIDSQTAKLDGKLQELVKRQESFDNLNHSIGDQFQKLSKLLADIHEQNSKLEAGVRNFSDQLSQLQAKQETSLTTFSTTLTSQLHTSLANVAASIPAQKVQQPQLNFSNDFKYIENKLRVEIANKSQYVTSFMLKEFVNLKELFQEIVNSNYGRIQESTNNLKSSSQQYQTSKGPSTQFPIGQETPPSEPCRNEVEMAASTSASAMNTPTTSEIYSQSPSYSELSLSDLISDASRANLNAQLQQAVCMVANKQPERYAEIITNVLNKASSSGQLAELLTPHKSLGSNSNDSNMIIPQTPSLQDKGSGNDRNFSLNFNLVSLIDDILQSNSPIKNAFGESGALLSTNKLFPATPDIAVYNMGEFKKPSAESVIKNFHNMLQTPKPKETVQIEEIPQKVLEVSDKKDEGKENEQKEVKKPEVEKENNVQDSGDKIASQAPEVPMETEDGEIMDDDDSDVSTEVIETQVLPNIPAPVFANQHMVATRPSPAHQPSPAHRPVTTIEILPPTPPEKTTLLEPTISVTSAPIITTPFSDVTKSMENTTEGHFKKPAVASTTAPRAANSRGRAHKFASSQEQIRHSLSGQTPEVSLVAPTVEPQVQTEVVQQQHVYYQDLSSNCYYAIDSSMASQLLYVNETDGNTYLQPNLESYYYQQNPDGTTQLMSVATGLPAGDTVQQALPVATGSGLASAISATTVSTMPTISISSFDGSQISSVSAADISGGSLTCNETIQDSSSVTSSVENKEPKVKEKESKKEKEKEKEKEKTKDKNFEKKSSSSSLLGKSPKKMVGGIGSGKGITRTGKGAISMSGKGSSRSRSVESPKPPSRGKNIRNGAKGAKSEEKVDDSGKAKKRKKDFDEEDKDKADKNKVSKPSKLTLCKDFDEFLRTQS